MSRDNLTETIRDAVRKGACNADLIAAYPQFPPHSLSVTASKLRKQMGVSVRHLGGPKLSLPKHLTKALDVECAGRRGFQNGHDLALRLLTIIIRDDLFDAVLDEPERNSTRFGR